MTVLEQLEDIYRYKKDDYNQIFATYPDDDLACPFFINSDDFSLKTKYNENRKNMETNTNLNQIYFE